MGTPTGKSGRKPSYHLERGELVRRGRIRSVFWILVGFGIVASWQTRCHDMGSPANVYFISSMA
jgi:hypothetical protein